MLLFVDHNDSFTNNLVAWFAAHSSHEICVVNCSEIERVTYLDSVKCVVFSPGPGHPLDYPKSKAFYQKIPPSIPFLGVCLGHQMMLASHGANIVPTTSYPVHGRQIEVHANLESRLLPKCVLSGTFVLYNSLGCLKTDEIFAKTMQLLYSEDNMCLVAEHKALPHIGVQFHPESFASSGGHIFLNAFLRQFHLQ